VNVYCVTLERVSTGERAPSLIVRKASEDEARSSAQDAIRQQSPDAVDLRVVTVDARQRP
jgi:hypothetical protein